MKLGKSSPLGLVVAAVGDALRRHEIQGVLTGGACASLHSGGEHPSAVVRFLLSGSETEERLVEAMHSLGFVRQGDRYAHPRVPFPVEFTRGPLAIGKDQALRPLEQVRGGARFTSLSPTDSCRERLAAFYRGDDPQGLADAIAIAIHQKVDWRIIRSWSEREGHLEGYEQFREEASRQHRRARTKKGRTASDPRQSPVTRKTMRQVPARRSKIAR